MDIRLNGRRAITAWRALDQTEIWTERRKEFRASGLPFCPRAFWLDKKLQPASRRSFADEVRLWRGHGIHDCLQYWMGQAGILFGDWECSRCRNTMGPSYVVHDVVGPPGQCPRHGVTLKYREYALDFEGMTGHPDGLIPDTADTEEAFSLLEFKTLQHRGFKGSSYPDWMTIKRPYGPHIEQANSYACMVQELKGFKITKVLIWYLSIDKPTWQPKIFEFDPDWDRFQRHIDTLHEIENQDLDGIPPVCDPDAKSPFCTFADMGYCSMRSRDLQRHLREQEP
jgi:CRISPR/Cas system-associated exonuclease Cas4 (RecB family)